MNIVTGYTGSPHVTSNAAQAFHQGIFGQFNTVLEVGSKFSAELTDVNTVTFSDGEGVIQGVHFRIDPGTTETVNISNGTTGYKRNDLICARYTKNAVTGVEDVSLVVIDGTPDETTATDPTVNTGDILTGDSPVDFPLYRVSFDGLTPTLTRLCQTISLVKLSAEANMVSGLEVCEPEVIVLPQFHYCVVYVHVRATSQIEVNKYLVSKLPIPYLNTDVGGILYSLDRDVNGLCSVTNDGKIQFCAIPANRNRFVSLAYFYKELNPDYPLSSGTLLI